MNERKEELREDNVVATEVKEESLINFQTCELKNLIHDWMWERDWNGEDFAKVLKQIGFDFPVDISLLMKTDDNCLLIDCTSSNMNYLVSVEKEGKIVTMDSRKRVTYQLRSGREFGDKEPQLVVREKVQTTNIENQLFSNYDKDIIRWKLKSYPNDILKICVDITSLRASYSELMLNIENVESYLCSLCDFSDSLGIYAKLMDLLGFTEESIKESSLISILYEGKKGCWDELLLSGYEVSYGQVDLYGVIEEDGNSYIVEVDGYWSFCSCDVLLTYDPEYGYELNLSGKDEFQLLSHDTPAILQNVKEIISDMWEILK